MKSLSAPQILSSKPRQPPVYLTGSTGGPGGGFAVIDEKILDRFWAKVKKSDGCWEWTAYKNEKGYGRFLWPKSGHRSMMMAHRFSYIVHYGAFDESLFILHKCDNPSCVNPEHLFTGTHQDNVRDMLEKGRDTQRKLTESDVIKIRGLAENGTPSLEISRMYNIDKAHAWAVTRGKSWPLVGGYIVPRTYKQRKKTT